MLDRTVIAEAVVDLIHPAGREVFATQLVMKDGKPVRNSDGYRVYESKVVHTRSPRDDTMIAFTDTDGLVSIRPLSIEEMVEFVLDAIEVVDGG